MTLTPKERLERLIANDTRNLNAWEVRYDPYKLPSLACLVADCAVRWAESTSIDKELALDAERNLRLAARLWEEWKC
jgi:hypothetical protein